MKKYLFMSVLIILFALSFNTVYAQNKTDEKYDIAISLLTNLQDKFEMAGTAENNTTRAEFIYNMVCLLNIPTVESSDDIFNDVAKDSYYYNSVRSAAELGWISKSDKFYPDSEIRYEEALKIGVCATGYYHFAEMRGGWPVGYLTTAGEIGLNKALNNNSGSVSYRDECILIYNILNTKCVLSDGIEESVGDKTILEKYFDVYHVEGIVSGDGRINLNNENYIPENRIVIGKENYFYKTDESVVGCYVDAYYKDDNDDDVIISLVPYKNNILEFSSREFDDVDGNNILFTNNGVEGKLKLSKTFSYIKNNGLVLWTGGDLSNIFEEDTASYQFIDNNDDNVYDIIKVESYKYTYVSKVDTYNGYIYDKFSLENMVDLSENDCKYTVSCLEDGALSEASINDIMTGTLIAVASSDDRLRNKIIICNDYVEGTISEKDDDNIMMGEKKYYISEYFSQNFDVIVGKSVGLYIGLHDEVVYMEHSAEDGMKYGWLIKCFEDDDSGDSIIYFKIFSQTGEVLKKELCDKVKIDNVAIKKENVITAIKSKINFENDEEKIIRFSLNAQDKIKTIDLVSLKNGSIKNGKENDDDSLELNFDGTYLYRPGPRMFSNIFNIKRSLVFLIPEKSEQNDDALYAVKNNEYFENGVSYPVYAYDVDLGGNASVVAMFGTSIGNDSIDNGTEGLIVEKYDGLNSDDEACKVLYVKSGKTYENIYIDGSKDYSVNMDELQNGDIIRYTVDSYNNLKDITLAFSIDNYSINSEYTKNDGKKEYSKGFVYSSANGYMYLASPDERNAYKPEMMPEDRISLTNINTSGVMTTFIDVIRSADGSKIKKVCVHNADDAEMRTYLESGSNVSYAVCFKQYNLTDKIYVYNIEYDGLN